MKKTDIPRAGGMAFQGEATTFHDAGRSLLKSWQEANVSPCSERGEGVRNEVGKGGRICRQE